MPEHHASLDAALARSGGPSAEDVEALAEVLHRKLCCDNPGHADWTNCPIDGPCSEDARAILASDWLAAHTAAAEARGAERGARAVVEAVEAELAAEETRLARFRPDPSGLLGNWLGGIRIAGHAAREAAARVESGA